MRSKEDRRPGDKTRARARAVPGLAATRAATPRGPALILTALLAMLWPAGTLFATPTPPVLLVNHEAGQCSQVIQGDDCSWCEPPAGWEVLGPAGEASCPAGYAQVDAPEMDCRRYETPFCCSGGAHRGDCEKLVIDEGAEVCGFAEIEGCALPGNWQTRPAGVEPQDWSCPAGYGWVEGEVACLAATVEPESGQVSPDATDPAASPDTESPWRGICFGLTCLIVVAVLFGVAAMFPVWYVSRQKERRTLPPSPRR